MLSLHELTLFLKIVRLIKMCFYTCIMIPIIGSQLVIQINYKIVSAIMRETIIFNIRTIV